MEENNYYKLGPHYKPPIHTRGLIFYHGRIQKSYGAEEPIAEDRPRVLMSSNFNGIAVVDKDTGHRHHLLATL